MKKLSTSSKQNKTFWGYWEAFLSIFINIILFSLKYWIGLKTASIAIIADAWHTLSDSFSSVILYFGFRISAKPADSKHPFGHGRAELISSLIIGTILFIIGFNIFLEALEKFKIHHSANYSKAAVFIIILSIVLKEALAIFSFRTGKKTDSQLLKTDGWHHQSDALSSLLILIGISLKQFFWWIDSFMGMGMSVLLFYAAYNVMKKSVSVLIGEAPDDELMSKIEAVIKKNTYHNVIPHHLHCHNYGNHREITFHIVLPAEMKLKDAHEIVEKIENSIRKELNIEPTIHIDPFSQNE
ncbi:MAG: hypothetical protein B6D62_05010 [Candidatus Cloacimonas sp. 4484_275]|nr:MAG: hypothetical protein B6D62_05010 [Candidatus Cloacimonas sp. 4484_275]